MSHVDCLRRAAGAAAICLLVACASPEERFEEHVQRGQDLAKAGDVEEAILEYRSALKIDSENVEANEQIANLLLRVGDLSATYYLGEAFRLDPTRIDIAMRLARVLLVSGETDDAERLIESALEAHPDSSAIHRTRAELLLYQNEPEQALASALKATELAPEDPTAWMELGRVHQGRLRMAELEHRPHGKGVRRDAIAAFQKADDLAGGLVTARIEIARLFGMRQSHREKAQEAFVSAVELAKEQDDRVAQFVAAEAAENFAIQAGRGAMQIWAIREMIAADDSRLDLWQKLARIVDATSHFGIVIYQELLQKRPDDVTAHMMFASYLAGKGHEREAIQYVQDLIDRDLGSPLPWEELIRLQIQQGRIANARATFVRMSDAYPDDPVTKRAEARIAIAEKRNEDAIAILEGLATDFDTAEINRLLALAEYRAGNPKQAKEAIQRSVASSREFSPETIRLKARIDDELADWSAVLASLSALAVRGHTLGERELVMRARAFYGTDQPEKGRAILEELLAGDTPSTAAAIEYARREGEDHPEEAAAHLGAALAREPANAEVLETLVEYDVRAGRLPAAIARINAALKTGRAKPGVLLTRAEVFAKAGKFDRAEADALRAFEADPTLPGAVDLLYEIYKVQDRVDEARKSFEEAEAAGVLHSGARLLLGRIYLRQGDDDRAQEMLEQVLRDDPNSTGAKSDLAYLLARKGSDLDRAQRLAEEAQQSLATDPNAADTMGYVYLKRGLHEAALEQFQRALELNAKLPGSIEPMLQYHLGLTLDAMDRKKEATSAFEKALALDADFPEAEDARRRIDSASGPEADASRPS